MNEHKSMAREFGNGNASESGSLTTPDAGPTPAGRPDEPAQGDPPPSGVAGVAAAQENEVGARALPLRRHGARAVAAALVLGPPRTAIVPRKIGRVELRRRLWHMTPGLLAFLLPLVPHPDPLAWQNLARVVVLGILLTIGVLLTYRLIARPGEQGWLLNAISYPAAVLLVLLLFPAQPELASVVLVVLAFGDGSATLLGMLFGRRPLPWNAAKTWFGTLGFLFSAAPLAGLAYWIEARPAVPLAVALACGGVAALVGTIAESVPVRLTDNLRVGVASALAAVLMQSLLVGWPS